MKRVRVKMLKTVDQLMKNDSYLLPESKAEELIRAGFAVGPTEPRKPVGPSETKPAFPSEVKDKSKPDPKKARTR